MTTRSKKPFGSSVSHAAAIRSLIKNNSKKKATLETTPRKASDRRADSNKAKIFRFKLHGLVWSNIIV